MDGITLSNQRHAALVSFRFNASPAVPRSVSSELRLSFVRWVPPAFDATDSVALERFFRDLPTLIEYVMVTDADRLYSFVTWLT